jgi:hypothetical protein
MFQALPPDLSRLSFDFYPGDHQGFTRVHPNHFKLLLFLSLCLAFFSLGVYTLARALLGSGDRVDKSGQEQSHKWSGQVFQSHK